MQEKWVDLKEEKMNLEDVLKGVQGPTIVKRVDIKEDLNPATDLTKVLREKKKQEEAKKEEYENLEIIGNEILID